MTKRTSFQEIAGKPGSEKAKPVAPPVSALLHTITGNPENPRDEHELDLEELIQSFREVGQLQPVLAVSRDVFLRHKPAHAKAIGEAEYVTIGGNRRLEAARALGWVRIDIAVRDDLGDGEGSLDEAVIIENIHRKNLTPIREAGFLQGMVDRYGSQGKVAKRIGKTQAYVSQRLALLKLEPELQDAVESGELKVKEARKIAAAPAAEQRQVWESSKEGSGEREAALETVTHNRVMASAAPAEAPPAAAPVRSEPASGGQSGPSSGPSVETVPAPRATEPTASEAESAKPTIRMPWDDGGRCGEISRAKTTVTEGLRMVEAMALGYGQNAIPVLESVLERLKKEQDAAPAQQEA